MSSQDEYLDLIARTLSGDSRAANSLMASTQKACSEYSRHALGLTDSDEIEDLIQEVGVRVFRALHQYRSSQGEYLTWCRTITRNAVATQRRNVSLRLRRLEERAGELVAHAAASHESMCPERRFEKSERREKLYRALDELPLTHRRVVEMQLQDKTYDDIAAELGLPVGTVKSRLNAARKVLARVLVPAP